MIFPIDPDEYCAHDEIAAQTMLGGIRRYPDGVHAFVVVEEPGDRVVLGCSDRDQLVAALRRAADEIEHGTHELPPVLETLAEFAARTGG